MKFTKTQVKLIYAALSSAILNEMDFYDAHIQYGKSIDKGVTNRTKKFIARMQALQAKIRKEFK